MKANGGPNALKRLTQFCRTQGAQAVAEKLSAMTAVSYRRDARTHTISVLREKSGESEIRIVRHPDRTIEWMTNTRRPTDGIYPMRSWMEHTIRERIEQELILEITRVLGNTAWQDAMSSASEEDEQSPMNAVRMSAATLYKNVALHTGLPRTWQSWAHLEEVPSIVAKLAGRHIVRWKTADLARKLHEGSGEYHVRLVARLTEQSQRPGTIPAPRTQWSTTVDSGKVLNTKDYNVTVLGETALEKLHRTSPELAQYYCQQVAENLGETPKPAHPGEIISMIREYTAMTPPEWKVFTRTGFRHLKPEDQRNPANIRLGCRAVSEANRPDANQDNAIYAASLSELHSHFEQAQWDQGNAWKTWVQVINRFLETPVTQDHVPQQLRRVADTLRHHMEQELPWGPTGWGEMVRRSDRWHVANAAARMRRYRTPEEAAITWESALGRAERGQLAVVPVTSMKELDDLAEQLENCLSTYWKDCSDGRARIFAIEDEDGRTAGAFELRKTSNGWTVGQVEGPKGKRSSNEDALIAAQETREDYETAEDRGRKARE